MLLPPPDECGIVIPVVGDDVTTVDGPDIVVDAAAGIAAVTVVDDRGDIVAVVYNRGDVVAAVDDDRGDIVAVGMF